MKELVYICVQPCDNYYVWQTHLWLESLRNIGQSDKAICLIFTPNYRDRNSEWDKLVNLYPESQFHFYKDVHGMSKLLGIYIPISRPYVLMSFFKQHPEMEKRAIFYCDCDIIFTEKFNIDSYINDDICYLSNTNSYINASYFDSKIKDVLPEKLEEYKKRDILEETTNLVGINRQIAEKYNLHSGGAQYLLKNIDWTFWDKVMTSCLKIKLHLQDVNKQFFESENKGFQVWTADMWAVLWNLWERKQETQVIPEMEFAWSSDSITKLDGNIGILHNAGITGLTQGEIPVFYKGVYHQGKSPFSDSHLEYVYNNEKSKRLCNWKYVELLIKLKEKYKL